MVFEGTTGVYERANVFIVLIPNKEERKRNMLIRKDLNNFFMFAL